MSVTGGRENNLIDERVDAISPVLLYSAVTCMLLATCHDIRRIIKKTFDSHVHSCTKNI